MGGGVNTVQIYKCVHSANQGWKFNMTTHKMVATFGGADGAFIGMEANPDCKPFGPPPPPPPPPPTPPNPYCVAYHPIHDGNVYDPSGPLLDDTGLWHTWEDDGAWSHWTSKDLIHWEGSL